MTRSACAPAALATTLMLTAWATSASAGPRRTAAPPGEARAHFVVQATLPTEVGPNASLVAEHGAAFVVANGDSHSVSIFETDSLRHRATVPVGEVPVAMTLSEDQRVVYVANMRGKSVTWVDLEEKAALRTVELGVTPRDIVRLGDRLLVGGYYEGELVALDAATGEETGRLTLATGLSSMLVHPTRGRAYVLNTSRDALYEVRVRPLQLVAQLGAEFEYKGVWDMEMSPDGSRIVVSQWGGDRLVLVRTFPLAIEAFVETGGDGPCALAIAPDGRHAVVAHSESDDAAIVDLERHHLRAVVPVGPFPFSDVAFTADSRHALVTADNARKLAVVDVDRFQTLGHVRVGRIPHVITPDGTGRFFVSNVSGDSVSVLQPTGEAGERFRALYP